MKLIRTEDAAGQVLCHDITQIIPGEFKGARFKASARKTSMSGRKSPASSTRTKLPPCSTRPLPVRISTAPSPGRARSN